MRRGSFFAPHFTTAPCPVLMSTRSHTSSYLPSPVFVFFSVTPLFSLHSRQHISGFMFSTQPSHSSILYELRQSTHCRQPLIRHSCVICDFPLGSHVYRSLGFRHNFRLSVSFTVKHLYVLNRSLRSVYTEKQACASHYNNFLTGREREHRSYVWAVQIL